MAVEAERRSFARASLKDGVRRLMSANSEVSESEPRAAVMLCRLNSLMDCTQVQSSAACWLIEACLGIRHETTRFLKGTTMAPIAVVASQKARGVSTGGGIQRSSLRVHGTLARCTALRRVLRSRSESW